jgi:hypothetical protein
MVWTLVYIELPVTDGRYPLPGVKEMVEEVVGVVPFIVASNSISVSGVVRLEDQYMVTTNVSSSLLSLSFWSVGVLVFVVNTVTCSNP